MLDWAYAQSSIALRQRRCQIMTNEQKIIKNKVGLLKLAQTLGSVSLGLQSDGLLQG